MSILIIIEINKIRWIIIRPKEDHESNCTDNGSSSAWLDDDKDSASLTPFSLFFNHHTISEPFLSLK